MVTLADIKHEIDPKEAILPEDNREATEWELEACRAMANVRRNGSDETRMEHQGWEGFKKILHQISERERKAKLPSRY